MRFYVNPCFTKYSFEITKSEKRRMPKKDHNFNQQCDSLNGKYSAGGTNNSMKLTNHRDTSYDLGDNYQADDSLTMEYRGHMSPREKELRRRNVRICGIVAAVVLIIIVAVITFVAVHVMKNDEKKIKSTTCSSVHIGEDMDENVSESKKAVQKIDSKNVCTTQRCKFIAANLKKSMNFSVDPCQDFHEFACGLWPITHPLPPSLPKLDTMGTLNIKKNRYLKEVIEQEIANSSTKTSSNGFKSKILRFYKSCLNVDKINNHGSKPLLNFVSKFGRWSPLKQWIQKDAKIPDITDLLIESHQYFPPSVYDDRVKSPLFKTIVKVNDNNSSQHILELNLPDLPIANPENYIGATRRARNILAKYKLLQTNYVALLGPSVDAKKILQELIDFERKLANITIDSSSLRNVMQSYNQTTIKNFTKEVGTEINWLKLVQGFFAPYNIEITENTFIGIRSIRFFKNLNDFIKVSNKQIVKDYIIWVCIWRFGSHASGPFQEADYNFQKAIIGIQERPKRWYRCIVDLEETMEFGLASLYVRGALTAEGKILATEILKNITNAFRRNLVNVEWMDVSTKAKAFEKVDSIKGNIGYPDYVKNETYLDILYKRVEINSEEYFTNTLNMYREKRGANMLLLTQPVDRTAYDLPPTLVEAYFDPNKNKMVFLAGIMHVPFYDIDGPMAMNYGALGLVVGHEVTHAFDDLGRMFDGNGEKKNWWTKTSTDAFTKRSRCMVEQYSKYEMYGEHVNGGFTIGENIADNGGIKVAYMAYKEWERMHGVEKSLPGIPLTMDQLLFVSHGQVWCGAYREEYIKRALKTDYHSPAKYRTIGPLSNLKEFSDAFKCPLGSPMNPVKKCRVW